MEAPTSLACHNVGITNYDVCKGVEEMVKKKRKHDLLCTHVKNFVNQVFIDGEEGDLQHGHDEELHWACFTQDGTKGDKDCGRAEVCIDYSAGTGDKAKYEMVRRQSAIQGQWFSLLQEVTVVLIDGDLDLAVIQVPQALHEEAPLQSEGGQE